MMKSKGNRPIADIPSHAEKLNWERRDCQRKEEAWTHLADELAKRRSWRGLISRAEAGDADAATRLLNAIYWLVGDADKTNWPNELRGYVLHGLERVLNDNVSMDKAFFMTKDRRGVQRATDKEFRDSQLARAVRYREVFKGMTQDTAFADVASSWTEFPCGTGVVGDESVRKAYRRYYRARGKKIDK